MSTDLPAVSAPGILGPGECKLLYDPLIRELCKLSSSTGTINDEEVLILALAAAQGALARYIAPDQHKDTQETVDEILGVLDHERVNEALERQARSLLTSRARANDPASPPLEAPSALPDVLEALYESEINVSVAIQSFWDGGWHWKVQLGDELNGIEAEQTFDPDEFRQCGAAWLVEKACELYSEGDFAKHSAPRLIRRHPELMVDNNERQ